MNICKMFWPENVECFPMETPDDEKFLAMLSKSQSQIRYTVGQSIEPEDLEEIYNRCRNFVLRSERIYLVTLSDLEIEEYQAVM
ncbi:hypothetical protein [Pedobacter suwonensis]|uniref:hypothetical protein n=3 Tax=Pedobacter suwonensis TaxID=332999 RepID=UPI00380E3D4A